MTTRDFERKVPSPTSSFPLLLHAGNEAIGKEGSLLNLAMM